MHRLQDLGRTPRKAERIVPITDLHPESSQSASIPYRGRFAPSPTGPLHLGSLFTALASYLQARSKGGGWHVRIDDVDRTRSVPGAADAILRTLECFGLTWDGPVAIQSGHDHKYERALRNLDARGLVFNCNCSRTEIARHGVRSGIYPGTCRQRQIPLGPDVATRMIAPDELFTVQDGLQGEYGQNLATDVGDFVIKRRDGLFAYHLATVVDDADLGITEVMRGADLLESTPRQIYLQRSVGLPTPAYAHLPVLIEASGQKLSKQNGAIAVDERNASAVIFQLLKLLAQKPPEELQSASVDTLLRWGTANWNAEPLKAVTTILANASKAP